MNSGVRTQIKRWTLENFHLCSAADILSLKLKFIKRARAGRPRDGRKYLLTGGDRPELPRAKEVFGALRMRPDSSVGEASVRPARTPGSLPPFCHLPHGEERHRAVGRPSPVQSSQVALRRSSAERASLEEEAGSFTGLRCRGAGWVTAQGSVIASTP